MKQWLVASGWWLVTLQVAMVIGPVPSAQAQKSHWGSPDDPVVKEIVAKERMWLDADCSRQPTLKDVIADDFQGTAPDGERTDKAAANSDGPNWPDRDCQLGPVKVQFFGADLAVAYGSESKIRRSADGKGAKHCLVWTDTWLRRDGKWQIIAAQDSSVKCQ